ncbi:MAG: hypothetical protein ACR2PI_12520 [Hyphomicrobiaceae bacterium]
MVLRALLTIGWLVIVPLLAFAGEADVVDVKVRKTAPQTFAFDVTVRHGDTGWKHYADRWDVVTEEGKVLGKRILHHPHENEQPFTRSLSGVKIPASVVRVVVRAHDKVHALGGAAKTVTVPH